MRIDSSYGIHAAADTSSSPQAAAAAADSQAVHPLSEDQAQLSGAHVQPATLVSQALQLPEIRQERVAALRQSVSGGSYRPAPEQVAGALFSSLIAGAAA